MMNTLSSTNNYFIDWTIQNEYYFWISVIYSTLNAHFHLYDLQQIWSIWQNENAKWKGNIKIPDSMLIFTVDRIAR